MKIKTAWKNKKQEVDTMKSIGKKTLAWVLSALLIAGCCLVAGVPKDRVSAETSEDFVYTVLEDGTAEITGYTGTDTKLEIPAEIDGYAVSSIGSYTFSYRYNLTEITIPNSVSSIGDSAFYGCTGLTVLTISGSVTSIGASAFYDCTSLTELTFSDNVTSIGDYAFYNCISLTEIVIPDGVTSIGSNAFSNCTSLTSITIPNSVISIGKMRFFDSYANAFSGCSNLTEIIVSEENPAYSSQDGILFTKEKDELLCYPAGKSGAAYVIPDSVTTIVGGAFSGAAGLRSVTIPDSVKEIGAEAFENCSGITAISIPENVSEISYAVFKGCTSLRNIAVAENNSDYASDDGVLYNKQMTELIQYPNAKEGAYTIPNGVIEFDSSTYPFQNCTGLTSLSIPASLTTYISSYDFNGCISLANIEVDENNTHYTSVDGVLYDDEVTMIYCYPLGKQDKEYTVPESLTRIFAGVSDNPYLEKVILNDDVISTYLTNSDLGAFRNCDSLQEICAPENSELYITVDGVLYDKDMTTLIFFPSGKEEYVIPDGVTQLTYAVFNSCTQLTSLTIPGSIRVIEAIEKGTGMFNGCTNLTTIVFGDGFQAIGTGNFNDCPSLTNVTIPVSVTSIGGYPGANTFKALADQITIYGYTGSYAEIYAKENGIPFVALDQPNLPFADIQDPDTYYYDAVQYVYQNGLMTGMNATTFGPSQTLSRAQFAVILYRMAGSPSVAGMANPFADNQQASFYRDAVIWCNNVGIITGYFNADGSFTGRFGPSDLITREQLATMLYRYANYAGMDTSASISLDDFGDSNRVSSFAADALQWAAAEGIVSGRQTTPPTIAPQDNASRADTAVMLQRFLA